MVLNSLTVGAAVAPTVIKTCGSHYLGNRKHRRQKPTAHISYDEGLHLIRSFLDYASHHTVEEIQAFTSQWVPSPRWVRTEDTRIPQEAITKAADAIIAQLGPHGIDRVGGRSWWQWRRSNKELRAEWIEMRAEFNRRKRAKEDCTRVMLYVHGGAYFFGSVDEHRYQMQRHARKLKARIFAPRYRLAPQYPFPCGLLDCLAAYLHLLTIQDPSTIILAGDSAGGGMVLSLLVILRDQGLPMPAGAILLSPWVDLTHSFPSVAGTSDFDYIPAHGFLHRPSISWPPPNNDDMRDVYLNAVRKLAVAELPRKSTQQERDKATEDAIGGSSAESFNKTLKPSNNPQNPAQESDTHAKRRDTILGPNTMLSIEIDGTTIEIKDQIQMYASNQLLNHPLVSPVLQPTLGGLPPLLIQVGGGEMLRDEQIYLAHKAANPGKYPAPSAIAAEYPPDLINKYKPTDVQLQVWDDLCHVAPTLSFTRPAKYMYRSIAQFGAWALARAQRTEIELLDDDYVSIISSDTDSESDQDNANSTTSGKHAPNATQGEVGKAGDPLPAFRAHMIRQRVDRHGVLYPLTNSQPGLELPADQIGVIKEGPVRKWLAAKKVWDEKFAKEKRRVQRQRMKDMEKGIPSFGNGEVPPPSALAGRTHVSMPKETVSKRSWGMSLWSLWGSSHDEKALEREGQLKSPGPTTSAPRKGSSARAKSQPTERARSRSHVRDLGQADADPAAGAHVPAAALAPMDGATLAPGFVPLRSANRETLGADIQSNTETSSIEEEKQALSPTAANGTMLVLPGTNVTLDHPEAMRPKADARIAFPFRLGRKSSHEGNASMITLESRNISTPLPEQDPGPLGAGTTGAQKTDEPGEHLSEANGTGIELSTAAKGVPERPQPERFETAQEVL